MILVCTKRLGIKVQNTLAHREGRTRSLQMIYGPNPPKSLTLYPIELGGHMTMIRKMPLCPI